jgi:hypothetical protein
VADERLSGELRAALAAREDLGPEYESDLVKSFLDRIDREVDIRVAARIGAQPAPRAAAPKARRSGSIVVPLGSVALGIPVTAIAASQLHGVYGFLGVLISWGGIAAVNVANAIGRNR